MGLSNTRIKLGSTVTPDLKDLCEREEPVYVGIAVALACGAMLLLLDSWLAPFVFLASIGMMILMNLGTNYFMGKGHEAQGDKPGDGSYRGTGYRCQGSIDRGSHRVPVVLMPFSLFIVFSFLILEDMPAKDVSALKGTIEKIDHVERRRSNLPDSVHGQVGGGRSIKEHGHHSSVPGVEHIVQLIRQQFHWYGNIH